MPLATAPTGCSPQRCSPRAIACQGTGELPQGLVRRAHGGALRAEGVHTAWIDRRRNTRWPTTRGTVEATTGMGRWIATGSGRRFTSWKTSLRYWQARWHHTPGPSDPGTPRHRIQQTIDLLHQELGLKRALEPP